jgi:hypothetical protein
VNEDLAIRLRQACHDRLPAGTVPLTAIRFLHWAPGNDKLWAGLERCLAEYMCASINGRAREPLLFFGLHSDTKKFPSKYQHLFSLGAVYLPYEEAEHEVVKHWQKACDDAEKPFDEELIIPYCEGLRGLLRNIRHLFERRLEHIETQRDIVASGSNDSSVFLEPTPQYTKGQQAMIDRLQQYRSFIERLENYPGNEGRLFAAMENFDVAWVGLNNALERSGKGNLPSMDPVLAILEEVAEGLKNSIACIKEIEKKTGRGSYE